MNDQMWADERRRETPHERLDRNLGELLQEVRVAQTGVQILFAFLLTLPFAARFTTTLPRDRLVYVITLAACTTAVILLTAPVVYHRLVFRQDRKAELVAVTSTLVIVGTAFLLAAIVGGLFLVLDVVAGLAPAIAIAGTATVAGISLWFVAPLARRRGAAISQPIGPQPRRGRPLVAHSPSPGRGQEEQGGASPRAEDQPKDLLHW